MCLFFTYDELVRLSSYQTLGGGISELCNMSCSRIKSGEQILNSWPWYSPNYAINSLTYEKY